MKKYNPKAICVKCGGKDICSFYEGGCGMACHPEHIKRACRNCGYEWEEKPLNKKQPPEKGK